MTVADVALEHLAADEAGLRARIHELEGDVITLRELLREALTVAHELTVERDVIRHRYHELLDYMRSLRAQVRRVA